MSGLDGRLIPSGQAWCRATVCEAHGRAWRATVGRASMVISCQRQRLHQETIDSLWLACTMGQSISPGIKCACRVGTIARTRDRLVLAEFLTYRLESSSYPQRSLAKAGSSTSKSLNWIVGNRGPKGFLMQAVLWNARHLLTER